MKSLLFTQQMSFLLRSLYFLFLLSNFLNTFVSPTQPALCNPDQKDALLELKTEFGIQEPDQFYYYTSIFSVSNISFYPKTESWVNKSDCCSWDGVTCNAKSGNVIGLNLTASCLHGRLKANSSLFRLHHLRDLNLAYNNFTDSPVPVEFTKLKELERLNLSMSILSSQIPVELLELTKLVSLDLSSSSRISKKSLSVDESFLRLLARILSNLRELDLSYVNISSKIPHEFSNMSSLRSLRFDSCNLFGEFPNSVLLMPNLQSITLEGNPNLRGNLPTFLVNNSLQTLGISFTSFSGSIPDSIANLKHLTSLKLSGLDFSGNIPFSLGSLSHLSSLDLSGNSFTGEIPSSLGNLSHLSDLYLSENNFIGKVPYSLGNLKELTSFGVSSNKLSGNFPSTLVNLTQLRYINLNHNNFTGFLPPNFSRLSKLEFFYASYNSFTGTIPSFSNISPLSDISLDNNQLSDLAGVENLSLLLSLQILSIGNNNFSGTPVDLNIFSSLKQILILSLSGIPLSTENITDFPSLWGSRLYLSNCNLSEFPKFIKTLKNLGDLDLSNNKIKGKVPDWLWTMDKLGEVYLSNNSLNGFEGSLKSYSGSQIRVLLLSSNALQGKFFVPSRSIQVYFASNNNFTGEIPLSICELSSLSILDLSDNNLQGSIPRCLETKMSTLFELNLRNNSLSGSLPDIFINAKRLMSLDVSHNRLVGNLPPSMRGCSSLEVLNVGNNQINNTFPFWLSSLQKLQVLVLRSNKFHGVLDHHQDFVGFPLLRIVDVSHNGFGGRLRSDYFTNWKAMFNNGDQTPLDYMRSGFRTYYSLVLMSHGIQLNLPRILRIFTAIDFSGNKLEGNIPESIGLLEGLHVFNLSSNGFTGNIPSSMRNLKTLESLDFSLNKLSGQIPMELGNLPSLAWINVSHNQLVGLIPQSTQFQTQKCSCYEGNPGLYGPTLTNVCGDIQIPKPLESEEEVEEEEEEWFSWVAAGFGVAPGVVLGLTIGYIVMTYKHEWFTKTFGRNKRQSTRTR